MTDLNAIRDMYLSGATAHAVAAHFGITQRQVARLALKYGFRRVDVGQRKMPITERDSGEPLALAKVAMSAAVNAARQGDARGMEIAARAAERVIKTALMIAQLTPPPPAPPQRDVQKLHDDRLIEIYEQQRRYDAGSRDDGAMPLWQRFDRPDLRKPGELPIVYWRVGGRGPEPVKPSPEEALYNMEARWLKDGLITEHSADTAEFRALREQGLAGRQTAVRMWEERNAAMIRQAQEADV